MSVTGESCHKTGPSSKNEHKHTYKHSSKSYRDESPAYKTRASSSNKHHSSESHSSSKAKHKHRRSPSPIYQHRRSPSPVYRDQRPPSPVYQYEHLSPLPPGRIVHLERCAGNRYRETCETGDSSKEYLVLGAGHLQALHPPHRENPLGTHYFILGDEPFTPEQKERCERGTGTPRPYHGSPPRGRSREDDPYREYNPWHHVPYGSDIPPRDNFPARGQSPDRDSNAYEVEEAG